MKLINMNINKYFHMIPLWKSPIKLPVELPVELQAPTARSAASTYLPQPLPSPGPCPALVDREKFRNTHTFFKHIFIKIN